jgi:hypothetical protein
MKKAVDFDAMMVIEQEVEESMQALATAFPKRQTISTLSQRKGPLPIDYTPTYYCVMCGTLSLLEGYIVYIAFNKTIVLIKALFAMLLIHQEKEETVSTQSETAAFASLLKVISNVTLLQCANQPRARLCRTLLE